MSEEILEAFNVQKSTVLGYERAILFFTSTRVIVAKTGSVGGGLSFMFGIFGSAIEVYSAEKKAKQLRQLSAENILNADKKNFAIQYSDVMKVEMKRPGRFSVAKISIVTKEKKHEFMLMQKKELFDDSVNLVRSVLADKLSIKE